MRNPTDRRRLALWLVLLLAGFVPATAGPLMLGDDAPRGLDRLLGVDGRRLALESFRGDAGAMVIFTDNSCPAAKAWESALVKLGNDYRAHSVTTVLVNPSDPRNSPEDEYAQLQASAARMGMKFPYVVDEGGRAARAFGATHVPQVFLFNGMGKLVYHGAVADDADPELAIERHLENALGALVERREIEQPETFASGCEIRFAE